MNTPNKLTEALTKAYDNSSLGHALLFWGSSTGALPFATALLCLNRTRNKPACGVCDSCKLLLTADTGAAPHPDFLHLVPESESGYTVGAVRELLEMWHRTHALSSNRVCWIERADLLSAQGGSPANALLKTLEEPRPNSFLILTTSRLDAVLPTIRSRCQSFHFSDSANEVAPRANSELLNLWEPLKGWLLAGAPVGQGLPALPPDQESFWEDRDRAITELIEVYESFWSTFWTAAQDRLTSDGGTRILNFFKRLETLVFQVKGYSNSFLQWHTLRSDARLGEYGNY